jgi:hypothetical protein
MTRIIFEIILFQVLGNNSQDLTVCHSRIIELPDNATNEVTCRQTQGGSLVISLDNACEVTESILQCRPLYISVRPTMPITSNFQTANCTRGM